jgi:hypothetical protein
MSQTTESKKAKEQVVAFFNDDKIVLPKAEWLGSELREFLGVPTQNKLFKEEPGRHEDTLIDPATNVSVKNGDKFYDLPVGVKG